jgi:ABC-2 type transport system ATP-binding protein
VIASDSTDEFVEHWRRIRLKVPADWSQPQFSGLRLENKFRNQRIMSLDSFDGGVEERLQASGAEVEAIDRMTLEEIFVSSVMRGREEVQS